MRRNAVRILCFLVAISIATAFALLHSGCRRREDLQSLQFTAVAYSPARGRSNVDWYMLPGGSQQTLATSHYYIELEITNAGKRPLVVPPVAAYVYADEGSVLNIRVLTEGSIIAARGTHRIYIDTDGYTEFLRLSAKAMSSPMHFCIFVSGRVFMCMLPEPKLLNQQKSVRLDLHEGGFVPATPRTSLVSLDKWPTEHHGSPYSQLFLMPPALMRKQETQTTWYFYYSRPEGSATGMDVEKTFSSDSIAADLVAIGVTPDTKLVHVSVTVYHDVHELMKRQEVQQEAPADVDKPRR